MNKPLDNADAELLLILQQGLPLEPHPFAVIGRRIGKSEDQVLQKAMFFIQSGLIRRFGAVFEARRLGYSSTLCAADIPQDQLERLVAAVKPHPGITHCYERDGHPNLWLTMTAPAPDLASELEKVSDLLKPFELFNFPARRTFKVGVVLDTRKRTQTEAPHNSESARASELPIPALEFSTRDRALIRLLQGNLALSSSDPLKPVAVELGIGYAELLALLSGWKKDRVIRRLGFIPHHRELGFAVNAMCAWQVSADKVEAAGNSLAQSDAVTHCYERIVNSVFPYNLFAMIHARTREEAAALQNQLAAQADLANGRIMWSLREFKKTSPVFFGTQTPATSCRG